MLAVAYATNISIRASNLITTFIHSNLALRASVSVPASVVLKICYFFWISKDLLFI